MGKGLTENGAVSNRILRIMRPSNVKSCYANVTTSNVAVVSQTASVDHSHTGSGVIQQHGKALPPMNYGYGPYGQQNYSYDFTSADGANGRAYQGAFPMGNRYNVPNIHGSFSGQNVAHYSAGSSPFPHYVMGSTSANTSTVGSGPLRPSVPAGNYPMAAAGGGVWNQESSIAQAAATSTATYSSNNTPSTPNHRNVNSCLEYNTVTTPTSSFGYPTPQVGYGAHSAIRHSHGIDLRNNQGLLAIAGPSHNLGLHAMGVAPVTAGLDENVGHTGGPCFDQLVRPESQSGHVRDLGGEFQGVPKTLNETEFAVPIEPTESLGNELLYPLKDRKLGNPDLVSLCDRKRYCYGNAADAFPGEVCFSSIYGGYSIQKGGVFTVKIMPEDDVCNRNDLQLKVSVEDLASGFSISSCKLHRRNLKGSYSTSLLTVASRDGGGFAHVGSEFRMALNRGRARTHATPIVFPCKGEPIVASFAFVCMQSCLVQHRLGGYKDLGWCVVCEISVKPRDASVAGEILHTYRTPVRVFKNKQFAEEVFEEAAEPKLPSYVYIPYIPAYKIPVLQEFLAFHKVYGRVKPYVYGLDDGEKNTSRKRRLE